MNKGVSVAVLATVVSFGIGRAQTSQAPVLSEPILKRTSANSEWTVFYFPDRKMAQELLGKKGGSIEGGVIPGSGRLPRSLTVSKNGSTYREVLLRGDGRTVEKWCVDGLQVYDVPETGQVARAVLPSVYYSDTFSDYRRSDFEELEWIGRDNFTGIKELGGRQVFEFQVSAAKRRLTPRETSELVDADGNKTGLPSSSGETGFTAYLDVATQRPLYFDDGISARIYKFSGQSPGVLNIPHRFQQELDAWRKKPTRRTLPKP